MISEDSRHQFCAISLLIFAIVSLILHLWTIAAVYNAAAVILFALYKREDNNHDAKDQ